jgi:thiamine-phosphate pyrophosphorylase
MAIRALPKGLCGVVFRHDGVAGRAELAERVARECQARRIAFVMVGDASLTHPTGSFVGVHLRGGRRQRRQRRGMVTASAHNIMEVRRAVKAGADIIFISPAFATNSHPGARPLGPVRWNFLARQAGGKKAYALGGISGKKITRLARYCCGAAGISALL